MSDEHKKNTVQAIVPNRQARETKEILYAGLEAFVNVGDSERDFQDFSEKYPYFWPFDIQDPDAGILLWDRAARPVFLVFRDYLRKLWINDPVADDSGYLSVLLGLNVRFADCSDNSSFQLCELFQAWAELRGTYPNVGIGIRPIVDPVWGLAVFTYAPTNDFQRAIHQLFLEHWRAKACTRCSSYFIAEKSAQIYCSTACSGGVKRDRARAWWNREGASRRTAAKQNRQKGSNEGGKHR